MSKVMRQFDCKQCGNMFFSRWDGAKYCSAACRQTAYRRRIKPESANHHDAAYRAIQTKREQEFTRDCPECNKYFFVDGFHTAQVYCSAACKQRHYRRRKAYYTQYDEKPQAIIRDSIDPMAALNAQLERAYDMQELQEKFDSKRE